MKIRNQGKILNVASVAAFAPGPYLSTYYASKAYLLHWGEAIAKELENTNITVSTLCPGSTSSNFGERAQASETRIFKNREILMSSDKVAEKAYKGLMKGKTVIIPGLTNKIGRTLIRFLPRRLVILFFAIVNSK